ncbi:Peptidyl-tRNA hydrolase II (PTH2) family protein [Euphorbia peplus]|nr:Peptidyl-tRNA hydrolase II (PTH2) family protein [Euphorbia peplus]
MNHHLLLHPSQIQCRFILLRRPNLPPSSRPKILSSSTRSLTRFSSNSMSQSTGESVAADETKLPSAEDVLVQYVVLRRDLIDTWPTGSVVTQGCHAAVAAIWENKEDDLTVKYCSPQNINSMHKVTLEVKGETQIKNLSEKLIGGGIAHKLWIEQPENIPTSIATKPYPKSVVSSFFKKLKLCK